MLMSEQQNLSSEEKMMLKIQESEKKKQLRDEMLLGDQNESAASKESEENQPKTLDVGSAAASYFSEQEKTKVNKKLKGIYLDEDVLKIYELEADARARGWGSKLTSDLLRAVFEREGLFEKYKNELLK